MAGNPILAEVSDKFGAIMIRMPVGFYGKARDPDQQSHTRDPRLPKTLESGA